MRSSRPPIVLLLLILPLAVRAADAGEWKPPVPPPDQFDWIELKSGEWLKGTIKGMENDQLQIDSEKLDLHTFDLEDILYIRSPRSFDLLRSDRSVVSGPIEIDTTTVKVSGLEFPRSQVTAFSASGKNELQHWSGTISAGAIARSGNTKSLDLTYHGDVTRRTASTRLILEYTRNISKLNEVETANNQRTSLTFDKFISDRAFVRLPSAEYLQDKFQNISQRVTVGVSYGYDFYKNPHFKWDATIGPAWQFSRFYSVQPGENIDKDAAAAVLTSHLEADLTDRIDFSMDYRGQITRREIGETTHHAETTLGVDLTKQLELDLTLTWDRVSQPKADDTGLVPLKDDFRLSLNLAIKL